MLLSCGKPAFVEDQALHIVGQIDQHDLGLGTLDPDCADEQHHMRLLLRQSATLFCAARIRILNIATQS